MSDTTPPGDIDRLARLFKQARRTTAAADDPNANVISQMAHNRAVNMAKTGSTSLSLATSRPTDPMFYWRQNNLPYDIWRDPKQLAEVRNFCRILYVTHPLIGSAIDIYSKYPLAGMEIVCPKDQSIAQFYNDLFLDTLDYEEFLANVGREYWLAGEAFPFGTFNELLGVWEADELLLPEDVNVIYSPFLREPRFEMRLPRHIREIIVNRKPELEYRQLISAYPELAMYANSSTFSDMEDDQYLIPVSNMLLQHVKRTGDSFHVRGVPILLRAFRAIVQEEMLNAAQDSIAQRLYTPLILARIGASATDLGTNIPWVPDQTDLDAFLEDVNSALAGDFRLLVTHFAVNMQSVFGRESMPDLSSDFERLTERQLQAFGLSKTMLSGGSGGETYAADALNRDLVSQLLTGYQKRIRRFFRRRAEVVAEAQGHYDFERKGGRAKPIMEEILETDPETGEQRVIERPKLLLPDLRIRAMNMKDEDNYHSLIENLRASGVPISMRSRLVNIPIDLEDEVQAVSDEQVDQAVAAQETRKRTYLALKSKGLPIPDDLREDFEPHVLQRGGTGNQPGEGEQQVLPTIGLVDAAPTVALAPTEEDLIAGQEAGTEQIPMMNDNVIQFLPRNRVLNQEQTGRSRPAESDEQRADMPKAGAFVDLSEWDDSMLREAGVEFVARMVEDTEETGLAVVGSYRTRHLGHRDESFFYLAEND